MVATTAFSLNPEKVWTSDFPHLSLPCWQSTCDQILKRGHTIFYSHVLSRACYYDADNQRSFFTISCTTYLCHFLQNLAVSNRQLLRKRILSYILMWVLDRTYITDTMILLFKIVIIRPKFLSPLPIQCVLFQKTETKAHSVKVFHVTGSSSARSTSAIFTRRRSKEDTSSKLSTSSRLPKISQILH